MTRRRFYAPVSAFAPDGRVVTLTADEARHLRDVLRLKPGYEIYVFDGAGREVQCEVAETGRDAVRLNVVRDVEPARPESPLEITLGLALLKGDKFDLVVQKSTELGVFSIAPLVTKQADIRLRDDADSSKKVTRWQRIALEAAKQSGRARVPEVFAPVSLEAFTRKRRDENGVFFSERDGESLIKASERFPRDLVSLNAIVGPEGGWADEEIALAKDNGWQIVTLSGRTLRAETAAIAVVVLLQHLFGDLY